MKLRMLVLLLIALLPSAALTQGTIYRWVDKNGQVHYSSVPRSPNAQPINIVNTANEPAPSASSASSAASATAAMTTITPEDSAACKSARQTLTKYLSATYLYTLDKDRKQHKLDPAQQAAAVAQAKNTVTQACSSTVSPP